MVQVRGMRLRGPWRRYAGASAALVLLVIVVVLAVPKSDQTQDRLLAEDPSPTPTAALDPTPSATPSATASPDASAEASGSASSQAAPARPQLDAEHMLSRPFVDHAFGGGQRGQAEDWEGTYGAPLACWPPFEARASWASLTRTWMWPGEVVVGETLARLGTVDDAREGLAHCRRTGPNGQPDGAATRSLSVGDQAYVAIDRKELYVQMHAGARVGRDLVLLQWRQPGPVNDTAALERALFAAAERVLGHDEPSPVQGPAPQPAAAFRGFLTHSQVRAASQDPRWNGQAWRADTRSDTGPLCLEPDVRLVVDGPTYERRWYGGVLNAMDYNEVRELIAHAVDEEAAERDFAACRDAASRSDPGFTTFAPVPGLGDDAFRTESMDLDGSTVTVFVREGSTYLVLTDRTTGDAVALARQALDTYAAARGG